jgi:hypothetical protein
MKRFIFSLDTSGGPSGVLQSRPMRVADRRRSTRRSVDHHMDEVTSRGGRIDAVAEDG